LEDSETLRACFSAALKRRRLRAGISQEDLAARSGLEQSYISLLERGSRLPGLDVFMRLSQSLGIKPTTFLADLEKGLKEGRDSK